MDNSKMDIDVIPADTTATGVTKDKSRPAGKSHDIYTTTIRTPPYAYAHLELITTAATTALDDLQVRSYLTSALKRFLGVTGSGMPVDILKVDGRHCWVRVPRQDLGAFAAALAAWPGSGAAVTGFLIRAAGDWLGALVTFCLIFPGGIFHPQVDERATTALVLVPACALPHATPHHTTPQPDRPDRCYDHFRILKST
jgi:ribonuclease P/MRP protein subunit POP8